MDISKCANKECPLRDKCWRFTAPDSPYRQAYADFEFKVNEKGEVKCEYFWDNKDYKDEHRMKNILESGELHVKK